MDVCQKTSYYHPQFIPLLIFYLLYNFLLTSCSLNTEILGIGGSSSSPSNSKNYEFPKELSVSEGSNGKINFKYIGDLTTSISISYEVIAGSASLNTNFTAANGSFEVNETSKEKEIVIPTFNTLMPFGQSKDFIIKWFLVENGAKVEIGQSIVKIEAKPDAIHLDPLDYELEKPSVIFDAGTYFLYLRNTKETGSELWRSDGTTAGTFLLKDICPGECSTQTSDFELIGGTLYFAIHNSYNLEVWKTDGTTAGTQIAFDIVTFATSLGVPNPEAENITPFTPPVTDSFLGNKILTTFNNKILITTLNTSNYKSRVYLTDGTLAGTQLLLTSDSSNQLAISTSADKIFVNDSSLWVSDGTTVNTTQLTTYSGYFSTPIHIKDGYAYTVLTPSFGTARVVRSDGTAPGTIMMSNLNLMFSNYIMTSQFIGGFFYFTFIKITPSYSVELWRVAPSGSSATQVMSISTAIGGQVRILGEAGGQILFYRDGYDTTLPALYVSDGTSAGTFKVSDLTEPLQSIHTIANINNKILFAIRYNRHSSEDTPDIWLSDGTVGGTTLASGFFDSFGLSNSNIIHIENNSILFKADKSGATKELWKTDLTIPGTTKILSLPTNLNEKKLSFLFEAMNKTWWSAFVEDNQSSKLITIDSNTSTISQAFNIGLKLKSSFLHKYDVFFSFGQTTPEWIKANNKLYFISKVNGSSRKLFELDTKTYNFTEKITLNSDEKHLATVGNKIYISDKVHNLRIFDAINEISENRTGLAVTDSKFSQNGNKLLFTGYDLVTGTEPWISDGSIANTLLIKDVTTGALSTYVQKVSNFGAQFLFSTLDSLYITDGTSPGTQLLSSSFSPGGAPRQFTELNSKSYFISVTSANGTELWVTDGTSGAGTSMVKDIRSGSLSSLSIVDNLSIVNGQLLFWADDGVNGKEPWISDGTSGGTQLLLDIRSGVSTSSPMPIGNISENLFLFAANNSTNGNELWITDGTLAGTKMLIDLCPGSCSSSFDHSNILIDNGKLYFWQLVTNGSTSTYSVLWVTDGTEVGTKQIADIRPYRTTTEINLMKTNRYIFFSALNSPEEVSKLWRSDGLPDGTTEMIETPNAYSPTNGIVFGDQLFFIQTLDGVGQVISIAK